LVWAPLRFSRSRALADEGREKGQYQTLTTAARESKYEALLRLVLSAGTPSGAQAGCRERGIFFLRTPFGEESADFVTALGVRVRWRLL